MAGDEARRPSDVPRGVLVGLIDEVIDEALEGEVCGCPQCEGCEI